MKKQAQPTREMKNAAMKIVAASAKIETLRPIIKGIQSQVLEMTEAKDEDGNLVSVENDYMMTDEYAAKYYPALDLAIRAAGFDVPEGYCPLLMAESEKRQAENELLIASEKFWQAAPGGQLKGLTYDKIRPHYKIYQEVLQATFSYTVQFI